MMYFNFCDGGRALRIAIGITSLAILLLASAAGAATLTVNASGGAMYTKIQDAINAASAGDTILVYSGTYYENVNVTKRLILRGIGMPVVDAGGSGSAITLAADGIRLEGFTAISGQVAGIMVTSSSNTLIGNNASNNEGDGITLLYSNNNTLSGNNVNSNRYGISLAFTSYYNTLTNNIAKENSEYDIYPSLSVCNNIIENNMGSGNRLIKYFNQSVNLQNENLSELILCNAGNSNVKNVTIEGSATKNNNGLIVISTDNSNFTNITSLNNFRGILLYYSNGNYMTNSIANSNLMGIQFDNSNSNYLTNNIAGSNDYGISLFSSSINTLTDNHVNNSQTAGFFLASSTSSILTNNIVSNNAYGMYLTHSSNNTIYNNYLYNTNNAYDDSINIWNIPKQARTNIIGGPYLGGNFWTNPSGTGFSQTCADNNSDGICDSYYTLDSNNIDYLPLAYNNTPTRSVSLTVDNTSSAAKTTSVNIPATYFINLTNTGNVTHTLYLTIQNPHNATVTLNMILGQTGFNLAPGTHATGLLNVSSATPESYVVNITATSQTDSADKAIITTNTTIVLLPPPPSGGGGSSGGGGGGGGSGGGGGVFPVEIRGTVFQDPASIPRWDASNFAGFYYNLKYNRSTELLNFIQPLGAYAPGRSMDRNQLEYTTTKVPVQFKANEKEGVNVSWAGVTAYQLVGWQAEKWIAVNGKANKIARLAFEMGGEDKKTLTTGETWSLGAGYELTINAIDARTTPRQVWFTLRKDGAIVDEGIGQAPQSSSIADKNKAVYLKTKTILGESDSLLFTVYVDTIFSGATSNLVQFKYAWLIDESSAKEIRSADKFGVFEVRAANANNIILTNENAVNLSSNTETTLMGNMKFRIADNPSVLRFYPFVEHTIPGVYEIRGRVAHDTTLIPAWDAQAFAGFYYDLDDDVGSEQLTLTSPVSGRSIPNNSLLYSTSPQEVRFTYTGFGKYQVIGFMADKYFAGYTSNTRPPNPRPVTNFNGISTLSNGTLHKVIIDDDTKRTIAVGSTIALQEGYVLKAADIDLNTRTMLLSLLKDGTEVDVSPLSAGETYVYTKTVGSTEALPLILVRSENVFSGQELQVMFLKGIFQISDMPTEVKLADQFGVMEVRSATKDLITMSNYRSIGLAKNTETGLLRNIKLKIADDDILRFYPKVDYVITESNVTLDTIPPNVTNLSLSTSTPGINQSVNITVNMNDTNLNTSRIFASLRSPGGHMNTSLMTGIGNGRYYYNFTNTSEYGRYNVTIIASDLAGNINDTEKTWFVTTKSSSRSSMLNGGKGEIANGSWVWNSTNFPDFVHKENLNVTVFANRSIPVEGLLYKISRDIIKKDAGASRNLINGEIWSPEMRYELTINAVDPKTTPRQVWVTTRKDGAVVDEGIVQESSPYARFSSILGEPSFFIIADKIFPGTPNDMVQLRFGLLTSDNVVVIQPGHKYEDLTVKRTSLDGLTQDLYLTNENAAINLTQDSSVKIMGDLYFRVENTANLSYYPYFKKANTIDVPAHNLSLDLSVNGSISAGINFTEMASVAPGVNPDLLGFKSMNKFIDINASDELRNHLEWVKIKLYYTQSELDITGLKETDLKILWHNENTSKWELIPQQGVDTADTGIYAGFAWVNISHFSVYSLAGINPAPLPPGGSSGGGETTSGSGGGGGGGGGGSSGENFTNIDVIEKYDLQISKDVLTPYRFTHAKNPIRFVNITGNTSLGIITASVEVLKSTSTLVKKPPEGLPYMYMNIWVGTTGFANEKNIKKALIKFRVSNDWLERNGIPASEVKMMRWDGSKWIALETKFIEKDGTFTYFDGETKNFSPFAITAKKPITEAKPLPVTTTPRPAVTTPAAAIPTKGTPGFEIALAIAVLLAMYVLGRKIRR